VTFIAPSLGADAGAHAAATSSAGDQRVRFANQPNGEPGRNHRFGTETLERGARVHRQHHPDGKPDVA
jgi:hypothetical protein